MSRKHFTKLLSSIPRARTLSLPVSYSTVNSIMCLKQTRYINTLSADSLGFKRQISKTRFLQHLLPWMHSLDNRKCLFDNIQGFSNFSVSTDTSDISRNDCREFSDPETENELSNDMKVILDFVSEEEEADLFNEVEPYLRRLRYESSHWDDAIHGYRETERKSWTQKNKKVIQRVRDIAFPPGTPQLAYVHVLDLQKEGYIKPHVDAVKFCGSTIAGISLLSPCVMRLVHTKDKRKFANFLLDRRSLYLMKDSARYDYTHEVLPDESLFKGRSIVKDRRISVICRNEP